MAGLAFRCKSLKFGWAKCTSDILAKSGPIRFRYEWRRGYVWPPVSCLQFTSFWCLFGGTFGKSRQILRLAQQVCQRYKLGRSTRSGLLKFLAERVVNFHNMNREWVPGSGFSCVMEPSRCIVVFLAKPLVFSLPKNMKPLGGLPCTGPRRFFWRPWSWNIRKPSATWSCRRKPFGSPWRNMMPAACRLQSQWCYCFT